MNFILHNKLYQELDPSIQGEISEKLYAAEKNIGLLRFFLILINTAVYFLLDRNQLITSLAIPIILIANLYGLLVVVFQPYRRYPLFLTSYFTSGTDAFLITFWLIATGGFDSPFYGLWYISILAISMRYSMAVTFRTALAYALFYLLIFFTDLYVNNRSPETYNLIIRLGYLGFVSILGGLMSKEIMDQIEAKIHSKKSQEEIQKQKQQLKEAQILLEKRVDERTIELEESNKQLLKINEEIDSFVYSASHDLKSPILNIEALLQILHENKADKTDFEKSIKEKLDISVERMKTTINNLAEVARSQKEVYEDVEPLRFEEILYDLISENEEIFKKENIQLEFNFNLANTVICSRKCLKSIMYNFLTNAIKYKDPTRSPVIKLYTQKEKEFIALFVEDNGLGIDMKKNGKKLFSLFKRFHDHVEGAGIGLYTVKKMVEKFNGDINVESEPGVGTRFKVRLKEPKRI